MIVHVQCGVVKEAKSGRMSVTAAAARMTPSIMLVHVDVRLQLRFMVYASGHSEHELMNSLWT